MDAEGEKLLYFFRSNWHQGIKWSDPFIVMAWFSRPISYSWRLPTWSDENLSSVMLIAYPFFYFFLKLVKNTTSLWGKIYYLQLGIEDRFQS